MENEQVNKQESQETFSLGIGKLLLLTLANKDLFKFAIY